LPVVDKRKNIHRKTRLSHKLFGSDKYSLRWRVYIIGCDLIGIEA